MTASRVSLTPARFWRNRPDVWSHRPGWPVFLPPRLGEHFGVGHQRVDSVDTLVEVVLDFVEIAVVGIGDFGRDIALADPVDILGRDIDRADERIAEIVDPADQFAPAACELARIGPRVASLPSTAASDQFIRFGQQAAHGIDAVVQVVLDFVEIAVVGVGDLRRDVALADPVHIFGRDIDRADKRIAQIVDAADQLSPAAREFGGIAACRQLAFHRGLDQLVRFPPAGRSSYRCSC